MAIYLSTTSFNNCVVRVLFSYSLKIAEMEERKKKKVLSLWRKCKVKEKVPNNCYNGG